MSNVNIEDMTGVELIEAIREAKRDYEDCGAFPPTNMNNQYPFESFVRLPPKEGVN